MTIRRKDYIEAGAGGDQENNCVCFMAFLDCVNNHRFIWICFLMYNNLLHRCGYYYFWCWYELCYTYIIMITSAEKHKTVIYIAGPVTEKDLVKKWWWLVHTASLLIHFTRSLLTQCCKKIKLLFCESTRIAFIKPDQFHSILSIRCAEEKKKLLF